MEEITSSIAHRRSEPAFAAHASGQPATGRTRHVATVRRYRHGWLGRRGVKGEATSLLHSFPTLSLSLAFSFSHARSNAAVAITMCLRRAHSLCTQHRHLIHFFHICVTTSSTTSNRHCSHSSLRKAPFRLAATAPSLEHRQALGSPWPRHSTTPPILLFSRL